MKVALDATPLTEPTGGIRRYTLELAKALRDEFPQDEFTLVSDQSYQDAGVEGVHNSTQTSPLWWSWNLPRWLRREGIDLFHGTDFAVPYLPVRPAVMTVHDLSPWRTGGSVRVRRRTPWLLRFGLATLVITPSEAVKRELLSRFPVPSDEVVAIPLAASSLFRPVESGGGRGSYFLYVGMVEKRKNLETALAAWRELRRRGRKIDFRIVGRSRGMPVDPEFALDYLGEVPDAELPFLYSQAAAVIYPSLYEGFGLPVLEAMQCGAPVLASSDPALLELSGGACLHMRAEDGRDWVEGMEEVLRNPQPWRERSLRRAAHFSWSRTAKRHGEAYRYAMRRFHG